MLKKCENLHKIAKYDFIIYIIRLSTCLHVHSSLVSYRTINFSPEYAMTYAIRTNFVLHNFISIWRCFLLI